MMRVWAEIDLDRIRANMLALKGCVPGARVMAVVKADGYGLGAVPAALSVDDLVWGYAVAAAEEGLNLRAHGITKPILVLGHVSEDDYERLIREEIRFAFFEESELPALAAAAEREGRKALVHVKVETGMSRIGASPEAAKQLLWTMKAYPSVEAEGIFTHLATADMADHSGADAQMEIFRSLTDGLSAEGLCPPLVHCGNSAATMVLPDTPGCLFREGIALYGYYPSEEMDHGTVKLLPAMSWKTSVSYVKTIAPGTSVGYGGTFTAEKAMRIATISVGYGDGYPRSLSNRGCVLIRGRRCPIVGRVCMDQVMVDVDGVPEAAKGDTVTLVGRDGEEELSCEEVAGLAGSFNYELLCNIGKRVPRLYFRNGQPVGQKDYFRDDYSDIARRL